MPRTKPRALIEVTYTAAAQDYLRSLPPEHFMEATAQGTQRKITLESLDLVCARRPDVHVFNELLVQYPRRGERRPGQVVPDNMVVICSKPLGAEGSFDLPLQPAKPFWVLEYVSRHNKRKDYDDNFDKYEKELKVPYFLLFYPDDQELTLYHYSGKKYSAILPNEQDRLPIPELELELALYQRWVRFWFRGELLPLPGDLQRELDETRQRLLDERRRVEDLQQTIDRERQARLAAERELEQLKSQLRATPNGRRTKDR
jgi:Uma2 family endonuclease